ncbi:MAG TPA: hypothetical protein VGG83_26680 [Trebonia sp.]
MFDLTIEFGGRPDALAVMGDALGQEAPGQLGAVTRAIAEAGARIEVLYSDHDHRLILVTSDQAVAANATKAWER